MEIDPWKNHKDKYFSDTLIENIKLGNNDEVASIFQSANPCKVTDSSGATLLHVAAKFGNVWLAKRLLRWGANVDAQNHLKETPLMFAIEKRNEETVQLLLEANADIFVQDSNGKCALRIASEIGVLNMLFYHIIYYTLQKRDYKQNFYEFVRALLDRVINEYLRNGRHTDSKLFHVTCPLWCFMPLKNIDVIRVLLEKGSPVNAKVLGSGDTSLHIAVNQLELETAKLLLEYGADVNMKNNEGKTPLARLARCNDLEKVLEMFKILTAAGATLVDYENQTIFVRSLFAGGNEEIVRCVLEHNMDLNFTDDVGTALHFLALNDDPDVFEALSEFDFDVNIRGGDSNWTPLHVAALQGNPNAIQFLLDRGADVNATCRMHFTPLNYLFEYREEGDDYHEENIKCIEILLVGGADPQIVTDKNNFFKFDRLQEPLPNYLIGMMQPILPYLPFVELSGQSITQIMQTTVLLIPQFKTVYESKKAELVEMKQIWLGNSVTLLDFLMASDEKISLYARNRKFTTASFSAVKIDSLEPCYQLKLNRSFSKFSELFESRKKAAIIIDEVLVEFCKMSVYNIAERIIEYIEDHQLHKFL